MMVIRETGILSKLRGPLNMTMSSSVANIKTQKGDFTINKRVRQGDALSTILFWNISLEISIKVHLETKK